MKTGISDHKHNNAFCQFGDTGHGQNSYDLLVLKNLFCNLDNKIISLQHNNKLADCSQHDNQLADWGR